MNRKSILFLTSLSALALLLVSELLYFSFFKSDRKEAVAVKQRVVQIATYSNLNAAIREQ